MNVRIVLVRPRNPLNIGAAARAMANFGFKRLTVVNPYEPVWRETVSAVGAEEIVKKAELSPTLEAALSGCTLALGTTCAKNRSMEQEVVSLPDLGNFIKKTAKGGAKLALVFGPEKTGLTKADLSLCRAVLHIPTSPQTPSMNLAQAVAVCCYELSKIGGEFCSPAQPQFRMPSIAEINLAVLELDAYFQKIGFQPGTPPEVRESNVRKALYRLNLLRSELFLLRAVAKKASEN